MSGQHDLSYLLLYSAANVVAATGINSSDSECSDSIQIPLLKKQTATAWRSKTLIIQGLSVQVISPLHHPEHRVGQTLTLDHTESVDVFSL